MREVDFILCSLTILKRERERERERGGGEGLILYFVHLQFSREREHPGKQDIGISAVARFRR